MTTTVTAVAGPIQFATNLLYEPPPEIDPAFQAEFDRIVPFADCGSFARKLKISWGMDRMEYCAGFLVPRYADTVNDPAKYVGRPGWVLEGYQSPDVYDQAEWESMEHLLGPFPREGVYDFLAYIEDDNQQFAPLDNRALDMVRSWMWWQGEGKKKSIEMWMQRLLESHERQQARNEAAKEKVGHEFGENVVKLFDSVPDTPNAWSLPTQRVPGFKKSSGSGLLVPNN